MASAAVVLVLPGSAVSRESDVPAVDALLPLDALAAASAGAARQPAADSGREGEEGPHGRPASHSSTDTGATTARQPRDLSL